MRLPRLPARPRRWSRSRAAATVCPPGGKALASSLAAKLQSGGGSLRHRGPGPQIARVAEDICIGCCRCVKVCPPMPSPWRGKQITTSSAGGLHRLRQLRRTLPTEAMVMQPVPVTVQHWVWPKPALA